MGYLHIDNLYKNTKVLAFKEVYALEKIHGTSAYIRWDREWSKDFIFFSGGEKYDNFVKLFNEEELRAKLIEAGLSNIIIYGEAYGGKQQGMSKTYGASLKFIAFDVKINDRWLDVEQAARFCEQFGVEFVYYEKGPATLEWLDSRRDAPSVQARRNGIEEDRIAEGIVIRPPFEVTLNNGGRLIAKHKRDEFRENRSPRRINPLNPEELKVLEDAEAIASDWVTENRLKNILSHIQGDVGLEKTPDIIKLMIKDIEVEGINKIKMTSETKRQIGKETAKIFKNYLNKKHDM